MPDNVAQPIIETIAALSANPRPRGYKKLKNRKVYRVRVRNYRIIYDIHDSELVIDVITLGHRKDVYE